MYSGAYEDGLNDAAGIVTELNLGMESDGRVSEREGSWLAADCTATGDQQALRPYLTGAPQTEPPICGPAALPHMDNRSRLRETLRDS